MAKALLLAAAALLAPVPAQGQLSASDRVTPEQLRRHMEVLASDAYEGRKPGTEGENKTLLYLASALQRLGFEPGAGGSSWYQPVGLVERSAFSHNAQWIAGLVPVAVAREDLVLVGREPVIDVADMPVVFAGHGTAQKAGELAGADLKGAAVLILQRAPEGSPDLSERRQHLVAAGARAVIVVQDPEIPWRSIASAHANPRARLQIQPVAEVQGAIHHLAAARLFREAGHSLDELARAAASPDFSAVPLRMRVSFAISTEIRSYTSHNVIGRLRGSGKTGESVLYLGHWDHLGICAPEDAADRICNGAVDNASGLAVLLEVAARLARGKRPVRDILVMGTTAEEMGLLGAEHFAARPTVPLSSIVAAVNVDTVAVHHAGAPVAVTGRGVAPLDRAIAATAAELGRAMDTDAEADDFVTRQDGWALARAGVPAVMVGGSFSDMKQLAAFLNGAYHKPDDDLRRPLILDGAAEDAELMVALARRLADPALYQPPRR